VQAGVFGAETVKCTLASATRIEAAVPVTTPLVVLTFIVSVFAGGTGAMLGVGGGSFLVPILVLAGLPFRVSGAGRSICGSACCSMWRRRLAGWLVA
jgi:uncharacterized membrane protein YfcA